MNRKGRTATIGMFDGVHVGHRFMLDNIKDAGDDMPIVVTFSNHPLSLIAPENAPQLLMTADEKIAVLRSAGFDPVVLEFNEDLRALTAEQFMKRLHDEMDVTTLAVGFNNRLGSDRKSFSGLKTIGEGLGVDVIGIPEYDEHKVSSSVVREAIGCGDVSLATDLLGRPYSIAGKVVDGNHIGRTLGFPTANIAPDDASKILPAIGVYAADAELDDGKRYRAVVNIGNRPTVDNSPEVHIEAFLDGFRGNLYGRRVKLYFLNRLRGERRFPDMESLRQAIANDLERARKC